MNIGKSINFIVIIMLLLCVFSFVSCGEANNEEFEDVTTPILHDKVNEQKLFNKTWEQTKCIFYDKIRQNATKKISFTDQIDPNWSSWYVLNLDEQKCGWWLVDEKGLLIQWGATGASDAGAYSVEYGGGYHSVIKLNDLELQYERENSDGSNNVYCYSIYSSSGGGSSLSEKPDIGFYEFTATKTSLKVQYKIYNSDGCKVANAKIYYGISSKSSTSKTATINGALITANITGLKAGTTYYVKCEAANNAGSTVTDVTRCITNY
ncbi:hypothetical protein [Bacteroides sp.]